MAVRSPVVDPELVEALALLPKASNGKLMDLSDIPALQRDMDELAATMATAFPPDERVEIRTLQVSRDDGTSLAVRLFEPDCADQEHPALLWCHPGGQVMGGAEGDDQYLAALSLTLECVVAAVDYRLAPQYPAPSGAEDVLLSYHHLIDRRTDLRLGRVGIAGASGGGAVAASAALMIRDSGFVEPSLLSLSCPMLDDRNETASSHEIVDIGIWDRQENEYAWAAVLGSRVGSDEVDPYSAAGRATDLSGLPPSFVAVGQYDLFRDEDLDFARRLISAGVPTDLHLYSGAFHAFDRFAPNSQITASFEQTWHAFLRRHLHS